MFSKRLCARWDSTSVNRALKSALSQRSTGV